MAPKNLRTTRPKQGPETAQKSPKTELVLGVRHAVMGALAGGAVLLSGIMGPPAFWPPSVPSEAAHQMKTDGYKQDIYSGQYMAPKLAKAATNEPLRGVRHANGEWAKDSEGEICFLRTSIARAVEAAEAGYYRSTEKLFDFNFCFRSNAKQVELCGDKGGQGCQSAGKSFHQAGMAIDLKNWREAFPYLKRQGFDWGCEGIEDDPYHFSKREIVDKGALKSLKKCGLVYAEMKFRHPGLIK